MPIIGSVKVANHDIQGGQRNALFLHHARNEWMESGGPRGQQELDEYELPWVRPSQWQGGHGKNTYQASLAKE